MQSDARHSGTRANACSLKVGQMIRVDSLTHLDRQRNITGSLHSALDDVAEQIDLPRERRSPTLASDLRHGASKVQVNVIGTVFGHQHRDGLTHSLRVDAVQLNTAGRLRLMMGNKPHTFWGALDKSATRDHFAHIQTSAIFTAQSPKSGIRDACHGRQNNRHVKVKGAN